MPVSEICFNDWFFLNVIFLELSYFFLFISSVFYLKNPVPWDPLLARVWTWFIKHLSLTLGKKKKKPSHLKLVRTTKFSTLSASIFTSKWILFLSEEFILDWEKSHEGREYFLCLFISPIELEEHWVHSWRDLENSCLLTEGIKWNLPNSSLDQLLVEIIAGGGNHETRENKRAWTIRPFSIVGFLYPSLTNKERNKRRSNTCP